MTDFGDNFSSNETVASLSTVHGSPLRRPFACGSSPLPLATYREVSRRLDLPSAVALVSFYGKSRCSSVSAKIFAGAARMTVGGALARLYWVVATLNCLCCLPMGTRR